MSETWQYIRIGGGNGATQTRAQPLQDMDEKVVPNIALSELFTTYEPINISPEGYVVVRERGYQFASPSPSAIDFSEIGTTGATSYGTWWTEEYNPDLRGQLGIRKFDQMRRSDGTVRGSLRLIKTPVTAGRWFMQPASTSTRDVNVAKFVWRCLQEFMSISWRQVLNEALLMLDFGYYMFEKVFTSRVVDGEPRVVWQKFAPRHPLQVTQWFFDNNGGPESVDLFAPTGDGRSYTVNIPVSKLLIFTNDREAGNITGISALRSAYKHWYFKDNLYKIDAIQKERHGIGIPVIVLPPNFSKRDAQLADEMGRNLRVNEKAHVVLPPGWELKFAKIEGQPVDAVNSIEHHDRMIMENILGTLVTRSERGVSASTDDHELFMKASRFVADTVADTFNKYAIPELVDYNYSRVGYPMLQVRRIGETTDWRALSFAIRNLIGANVLHPDDKLETWARDEMDLPIRDEKTDRVIEMQKQQQALALAKAKAAQHTPGQQPEPPGQQKAQGAEKPGLPRQPSNPQVNPGGTRVGGATSNSA